jgi:hypothetical protein
MPNGDIVGNFVVIDVNPRRSPKVGLEDPIIDGFI